MIPLCIDLDGTLIFEDTLNEAMTLYLRRSFFHIFPLLHWFLQGRAHLKAQLFKRVTLDVSQLTYNEALIAFIKTERAKGRQTVLVTATDERIAKKVAEHCPLFDEVLASNGKINLRSHAKASALNQRYGLKQYDYAGNSSCDFAVWKCAHEAIVVNASQPVLEKAERIGKVSLIIPLQRRGGTRSVTGWLIHKIKFLVRSAYAVNHPVGFAATPPLEGNFKSFSDYLTETRTLITNRRNDLRKQKPEIREKIIEANMPFEMRPENYDGKRAILLVHGLFDSPFTVRDLGQFFYTQGFLVRAILLPGHGTIPQDLLTTNASDWIASSQWGLDSLKSEAETIYYLGFSTGASLGVYHALKGESLAGLFLIAPALKLKPFMRYCSFFFGWLHHLFKQNKWVHSKCPAIHTRYTAYPAKSGEDLSSLIRSIEQMSLTTHLVPPIFMVLSDEDETVDSQAALEFFLTQNNAHNRLIYYTRQVKTFNDPRMTVASSVYPAEKILSFSHICLPIAPSNEVYGRKNTKTVHHKGALSHHNTQKYPHFERLSYNPDYEHMLELVSQFIWDITKK